MTPNAILPQRTRTTTPFPNVDLHEREIDWGANGMSLAVACDGDSLSWRLVAAEAIHALANARQDIRRLQERYDSLLEEFRALRASQEAV